tara:strand:- start:100 stop:360 length:261 start_codon:yes stop_codon:yes gene_type:complete
MKTQKIVELSENLDNKNKLAILAIIDLKTDSDMEKLLDRMDLMQKSNDLMQKSLESKLDSVNIKYNIVIGAISLLTIFIGIVKFIE